MEMLRAAVVMSHVLLKCGPLECTEVLSVALNPPRNQKGVRLVKFGT